MPNSGKCYSATQPQIQIAKRRNQGQTGNGHNEISASTISLLKREPINSNSQLTDHSKSSESITHSSSKEKANTQQTLILKRAGTPNLGNAGIGIIPSQQHDQSTGEIRSIYQILQQYIFPEEHAIQLIDNDLNFINTTKNPSNFNFLTSELKGTMDFLVVTIIGPPRVGKSTILDLLITKGIICDSESKKFLNKSNKKDNKATYFWISKENVIFIEMASVFDGEASADLIPTIEKFSTLESTVTSWNLRLVRWALSVSHILLLVSTSILDMNLVELINSASMIRPKESLFGDSAYPELVFIANQIRGGKEVVDAVKEDLQPISELPDILGIGRRPRIKENFFVLPHFSDCHVFETNELSSRYQNFSNRFWEFNHWMRTNFGEDDSNTGIGSNGSSGIGGTVDSLKKIPQTIPFLDWFNSAQCLWDEMNSVSYFHEYIKLNIH